MDRLGIPDHLDEEHDGEDYHHGGMMMVVMMMVMEVGMMKMLMIMMVNVMIAIHQKSSFLPNKQNGAKKGTTRK